MTLERGDGPGGGLRLVCVPTTPTLPIELLVVDESHHVYADTSLRRAVEDLVQPSHHTRRLLLADISQSAGSSIPFPRECERVRLTEVVRCSKRIIAGAMAFQLGGEQKLLTRCHHESTGPPLKSFLFDMEADRYGSIAACYAHHVCEAIKHVKESYAGLALHDRLAILCPTSDFATTLHEPLLTALSEAFPSWTVNLISAAEASASIGTALDHASEPTEGDAGCESLVLDAIDQFDGLERLIVIGVGLDQPISDLPDAAMASEGGEEQHERSADDQHTRSMLYRAVTRAHMQVLVVNELLSGGWLEFLGSVRLRDDERFDAHRAIDRCEAAAVEEIVSSEIDQLLRDGARDANLPLDATSVAVLRGEVARATEGGIEMKSAVDETLRGWASEVRQVAIAIERAAAQLNADLSAPSTAAAVEVASGGGGDAGSSGDGGGGSAATLLDELTLSVAVTLRKGEAVRLDLAAESAVKAHQEKQLSAQVEAELRAQTAMPAESELANLPAFHRPALPNLRKP